MNTGEFVTAILFPVLGGLGIFLLGMKNMSEGLQAVAGDGLRKAIGAVTNNRFMGVLMGLLITCVIQSSSVTTVMVVGLVNSGFMTLMQAIGVIFGANIGTTITGWILVLKIGKYGLPILGIAAFFFLFSKKEKLRYIGMTVMGIGMIFFGLEMMKNGFKPLASHEEFKTWFHAFQAVSYLGIIKCAFVGCLLTMIVQSSSATLGITIGLAASGLIEFRTAAALVLGENVGTTITAYLASLGASTNAKRSAYAHMIFNVLGTTWFILLFPVAIPLITKILIHDPSAMVMNGGEATYPYVTSAIALVHTTFNVANVVLFLPLVGLLAKLVTRLAPDKEGEEIPHLTYLDVRMLDTPALGVVQSKKQILFMGSSVQQMLERLGKVLEKPEGNDELELKIFHYEDILDNVQKEVVLFLSGLVSGQVPHEVMERARHQLRMADEYESLSDYVTNVLKGIRKMRTNKLELSSEGRQELLDLNRRVLDYVSKINIAVETGSLDLAEPLLTEGEEITLTMKDYRQKHLVRLAEHKVKPLSSLVFTDMLNSYRRMKDHALNIVEVVAGEK